MGWASGAPPYSETRVAGCRSAPWARARRGPSSAGPGVGRLAGGAGRCLPLAVLPPPLPGLSRAPSPFPVPIRAAFSRDPHGAQLTGRVVYGPSSPRSRRPPARHSPAQVPARPSARLSVCASVCLSVRRSWPRALRAESRAAGAQRGAPGREIAGRGPGRGRPGSGPPPPRRRRICRGRGPASLLGLFLGPSRAGAAAHGPPAWKRRTRVPQRRSGGRLGA